MKDKILDVLHQVMLGNLRVWQGRNKLYFLLHESEIPLSDSNNALPKISKKIYKLIHLHGNRCIFCAEECVPIKECNRYTLHIATVDHVLPKSRGGINHMDNCLVSCGDCNESKGKGFFPTGYYWGKRNKLEPIKLEGLETRLLTL